MLTWMALRFGHGTGTNFRWSPIEEGAALPYNRLVFTVIETPVYSRKAEALLSDSEREDFAVFISRNSKLIKEAIERD